MFWSPGQGVLIRAVRLPPSPDPTHLDASLPTNGPHALKRAFRHLGSTGTESALLYFAMVLFLCICVLLCFALVLFLFICALLCFALLLPLTSLCLALRCVALFSCSACVAMFACFASSALLALLACLLCLRRLRSLLCLLSFTLLFSLAATTKAVCQTQRQAWRQTPN